MIKKILSLLGSKSIKRKEAQEVERQTVVPQTLYDLLPEEPLKLRILFDGPIFDPKGNEVGMRVSIEKAKTGRPKTIYTLPTNEKQQYATGKRSVER